VHTRRDPRGVVARSRQLRCAIGLPLSDGRLCTNGQGIEDVVFVRNVLCMSDGKAQAVLGFVVATEPD
jgi:hypothetical protein